jgi:hypothetical protein
MKEDIIRMAREAGLRSAVILHLYGGKEGALCDSEIEELAQIERFFHMTQAAERNKVASWMMTKGYATGHGDATEDLLEELDWQVRESERNACAAIARQWDVDHPGSNYGGCIATLMEARGQA